MCQKVHVLIASSLVENKNENCTIILIPKGNSYCRARATPRTFKVSSEGLSPEIDILTWPSIPVHVLTESAVA